MTDEEKKNLMELIFSNQHRNFLCMNSMHNCDKCGAEGLLFSQPLLVLGLVPLCKNCITEEEKTTIDRVADTLNDCRVWADDKRFVFGSGSSNEHQMNPDPVDGRVGIGCQKCQPGLSEER